MNQEIYSQELKYITDVYYDISPNAYEEWIRFYKNYNKHIHQLNAEMYFDIEYQYCRSLLEVNRRTDFYQHIEYCISNTLNGDNFGSLERYYFEHFLLLKAQALTEETKISQAKTIYKQLLHKHPEIKEYREQVFKLNVEEALIDFKPVKALTIVFLLLTITISVFGELFIEPFYATAWQYLEIIRNICFVGSLSLFLGSYVVAIRKGMREM